VTRQRPSGYTVAWLAWLCLFLAIEIPAALREKAGTVKTLSRHVWERWAPKPWQRSLVCGFVVELAVHFADAGAHWWSGGGAVIALGVPVVALIVWREAWERSGRL
jgi:hypothetical protein